MSLSLPGRAFLAGTVALTFVGACTAEQVLDPDVRAAPASVTARAPNAPNPPIVWLHYDYMVKEGPNGHSHQPHPGSLQMVVDAFKRQGIHLKIDPRSTAIPEHEFLSLTCDDPARGVAGLPQLRAKHFDPKGSQAWHYAVFGHSAVLHCDTWRTYGGVADLPGYNLIVGVGRLFYGSYPIFPDCAVNFMERCQRLEAAMLLHELGHNLDLLHGGGDENNWKVNYLSVMNHMWNIVGVPYAATPGDTVLAGYRVDLSDYALPDLDKQHLDERVGLGGRMDDRTLSYYTCYDCTTWWAAPIATHGPVDWNGNGVIEPDVRVDVAMLREYLISGWDARPRYNVERGFNDWAHVHRFLRTPEYVTGEKRRLRVEPE